MECSRSFVIDIPVPRFCNKELNLRIKESQLQRRLKKAVVRKPRKLSKDFFKIYTFPSKHPIRTHVIKRDEVLLPYRLYAKQHDKIKHNNQLNVTVQQKYKLILSDYKNRLDVDDPCDEVKAVTDIDKDFFNYINGRHLTDRAPLYKTLKTLTTYQLRTKLEAGYRNDQILKIDLNHRNEMRIFEQSLQIYDEQTKYLTNFISEDYNKSISLLKQCDDFEKKVNMKIVELHLLADQQFTIISNLIGLDNMYYLQQSYGRFLYYLSPPRWRASNRKFAQSMEIEVKGFDLGGGDEETFNVIFDKMKKECFNDLVSPALYFTQPYELLRLFEGIEKQQLSYLEYVTHLAPMLKQAREESKLLKNSIIQDNALVLNTIKSLEAILKFNEVRCAQLETKFFKIINGLFYASVGAPEVINMFLDLEYCYGKLYSEKPINSDLITLAKDLESFYMYYWKCLDAILSDKTNIQKAVTQYEEIQRKKFRRAKFAKRELCEFERLKRSLIRAFEPPSSRAGVLHNRTVSENNRPCFKLNKAVKPNKLKKKHSGQDFSKTTPIKTLTASELEYLELFTEWTCDEDPYKYLHSDSVYEIKPM